MVEVCVCVCDSDRRIAFKNDTRPTRVCYYYIIIINVIYIFIFFHSPHGGARNIKYYIIICISVGYRRRPVKVQRISLRRRLDDDAAGRATR